MKTEKQKLEKSTIEQLREIRDKISVETQNMTFGELKKYIDTQLDKMPLFPLAVWNK
jgi:hypothetical protein